MNTAREHGQCVRDPYAQTPLQRFVLDLLHEENRACMGKLGRLMDCRVTQFSEIVQLYL